MNLYFIRHGEIDSNVNKVYAGTSSEPLNLSGKKQAEKAGYYLKNKIINKLYSSPIKRTYQTAEIIGSITGNKPIMYNSFRELSMGPWEGLSEDQIARDYRKQWETWNKAPAELTMDGRETLDDLLKRVLSGLKQIKLTEVENVAVVTHVAIIRVMLLYVNKRSLNDYREISVPKNGGIYLWQNGKVFNELDIDIN